MIPKDYQPCGYPHRDAPAVLDALHTVRDLPTSADRIVYLALVASQWRRAVELHGGVFATTATSRWTAYANYLESVGVRIIRYAEPRLGATSYARSFL